MRLLIATRHPVVIGGTETYVREVIPLLRRTAPWEVGLLHEEPEVAGGEPACDQDVARWRWDRGDARRVLDALQGWRPDVVYVQSLIDPALEGELLARFPAVRFAHDYAALCVSGTRRLAHLGSAPCPRVLGRGCLACYLPLGCGGRSPRTLVTLYRRARAQARNLPRYRRVLCASGYVRDLLLRQGLPEERVAVAPLFPVDAPDPGAATASSSGAARLLFAGRLTREKGCEVLLRAAPLAARLLGRPLELTVAGDGPERTRLGLVAGRLDPSLAEVRFCGWVPPEQLRALMRESDLLGFPSLWPEPFGLVGVEAGRVGLPAVAFSGGGVNEWLEPGVSGEVAPAFPARSGSLARAIARALSTPAHHERLRAGARRASLRFTPERHLEILLPVLSEATR